MMTTTRNDITVTANELHALTLAVNNKTQALNEAIAPAHKSVEWHTNAEHTAQAAVSAALEELSTADLRTLKTTKPQSRMAEQTMASVLLLGDFDTTREDDGCANVSWSACQMFLEATTGDLGGERHVENDHLIGVLRAINPSSISIPADSWRQLRDIISRKTFEVRATSDIGVGALAKWVLATIACHDLAVGKALAAAKAAQDDSTLTANEAERRVVARQEAIQQLEEAARPLARLVAELNGHLASAQPALDAAHQSLDVLSKADLAELKVMHCPPSRVKLVMETVCVLLGCPPKTDYWETAKALLGDASFMSTLRSFDKEHVPMERVATLKATYLCLPELSPEAIGNTSKACKSLAMWVHAIVAFKELIAQLAAPQSLLAEAQAALDHAHDALPPHVGANLGRAADGTVVDTDISDAESVVTEASVLSDWSHLSRDSVWRSAARARTNEDEDDVHSVAASDWSEASAAAFAALDGLKVDDVSCRLSMTPPLSRAPDPEVVSCVRRLPRSSP